MLIINTTYYLDDEWKNDVIKKVLIPKVHQIKKRSLTRKPEVRIEYKAFFFIKLKIDINNKVTS